MQKAQTLKGFRDFNPVEMDLRNNVIAKLKSVFQKYGFLEIQTPSLEYAEVLLGKYGDEAEKLVYTFEDKGGRKVGLRYDLTIPLARYVITNNSDIIYPFKAFRIQPVWRAENTQKGRYRELCQCDFDIVGSSSLLADAEVICILYESFTSLGFMAFKIKINSRDILYNCLKDAGIPKEKWQTALSVIDKLDKKSEKEVLDELNEKGLTKPQTDKLFFGIKNSKPDETINNVIKYCGKLGISRNLVFTPNLVRGLDYYTKLIFEVTVDEPNIGSIAGGGRYDNLIRSLGGPNLPATGASIGLDRVCDVISENNLVQKTLNKDQKVLVSVFSDKQIDSSLQVTSLLRNSGIATEIYINENDKLDKQLKYAGRNNFTWAVVIGPNEVLKGSVVLKDLKSKKQETIPTQALLTKIK